jgi:hypothetical protein
VPFVLAGGRNVLKTGRTVRHDDEHHNALLATVAVAMGCDSRPFGHPDYAREPLWGLLT